jgi:hypothetical protein
MPTNSTHTAQETGTETDEFAGGDNYPSANDVAGTDAPGLTRPTEPYATEAPLAEAGRDTIQTAGQLVERAANTGISQLDRGRQQTAEGLHALAGRLLMASSELEYQPAMANVAEFTAEGTERLATYLRDTDVRQIVSNVETTARRQPLLFIGGAFLVGLAAARFLKAAGGSSGQDRNGHASGSSGDLTGGRTDRFATYGIGGQPVRTDTGGV